MIRMQGTGGELRVGYAVAARLRRWKIEHDILIADAEIDPFWIEEEAERTLRLNMGNSIYSWENVTVDCLQPFTVRIPGSPERRRL